VRGQHHHGFGELGSRVQQAIALSALAQLIQASHGRDDALLAAAFFPTVLDDLFR
jgi:xanthine/CO dehydrogenase XdhC/CoxF family maturation factor